MSTQIHPPTQTTIKSTCMHRYRKAVTNQTSLITSLKTTTNSIKPIDGSLNTTQKVRTRIYCKVTPSHPLYIARYGGSEKG